LKKTILIKNITLLALLIISFFSYSQSYADKNYYLIDSLVFDDLSSYDLNLIDSCLTVYHSDVHDTSKVAAIAALVSDCYDEVVWPKYNYWLLNFVKNKIPETDNDAALKMYQSAYVNSLNNHGYFIKLQGNYEKALYYYEIALVLEKANNNQEGIAFCYNNMGRIYDDQDNIKLALEYFNKSLEINKNIGNNDGVATGYVNIGTIYHKQGDVTKAIEYYYKSLKIFEDEDDQNGIATGLNNIGTLYFEQGNKKKSLECFKQSLDIREKINDKEGEAASLSNLGYVFFGAEAYPEALNYHLKSLNIRKEIGDKNGSASSLNSVGGVYEIQNQLDNAYKYYLESLQLYEEIGSKYGIAICLKNLGSIDLKHGKVNLAKSRFTESLALAKEIGYPKVISESSLRLSEVYEKTGGYEEALIYYRAYQYMQDSILNLETKKTSLKQEAKYEYEKQKLIDDVVHQEQKRIDEAKYDAELAIKEKEKENQKMLTYFAIFVVVLVVGFLLFVIKRLEIARVQNQIIEDQKKHVEEIHRERTDSINYAKRLQTAILPSENEFHETFSEAFVLFKPKDIISGDFYWIENRDNQVCFAVADCTGHGVPASIVSVVCHNAIDRAVREHEYKSTGAILDMSRDIILEEFENSDEEILDGMDIGLCSISSGILSFSGAYISAWIIRDGALIILKGDRQPVGKYFKSEPFNSQTFELQEGDFIYLFSDGIIDQFGGYDEKKRKLKSSGLKKFLLDNYTKTPEQQKQALHHFFEEWKGDLDQIDDVCLMGVKYTKKKV